MKRIHFLGILGTGMSSLAIYCQKKGYFITGSDLSPPTNANIPDWLPLANYRNFFDTIVIDKADMVIYSTAIKNDHEEVIYSKKIIKLFCIALS